MNFDKIHDVILSYAKTIITVALMLIGLIIGIVVGAILGAVYMTAIIIDYWYEKFNKWVINKI